MSIARTVQPVNTASIVVHVPDVSIARTASKVGTVLIVRRVTDVSPLSKPKELILSKKRRHRQNTILQFPTTGDARPHPLKMSAQQQQQLVETFELCMFRNVSEHQLKKLVDRFGYV